MVEISQHLEGVRQFPVTSLYTPLGGEVFHVK